MLNFFLSWTIPRTINPGCGPSHRTIITVVNAPRSECFHSYSWRGTNRSKERFGDRGTASRFTGCLRDYEARRDPGPNVIPKRDRIAAPRVRNREADTSRSRAATRDLWWFVRIYVRPGRRAWLPRPHPRRVTVWDRTWRTWPTFPSGSTGDPSS